ncbi:MAG TPA: F0F1 ATP synthase subunit B [Kiritimatiellia bacterium]|nr:F0F1 ATP synthase subunit B [Kiritimatiellia bacterium]
MIELGVPILLAAADPAELFYPKPYMVGLTWVTFILMTVVLYKFAWKPILTALEKRESTIRESLENVEKSKAELEFMEERRRLIQEQAEAKAKAIIEDARRGAVEAAAVIEKKARQEADILVDNARRDIRIAQDQALAAIRRESADLAIEVARKILKDQLDEPRGRTVADQFIARI